MMLHSNLVSMEHEVSNYERKFREGPPSRLDVQRAKLENDKMHLAAYELDRRSLVPRDKHLDQQFAELEILSQRSRLDRIRLTLSNALMRLADTIRPTANDVASARS